MGASHRQGGEGHFVTDPISPCRLGLLLRVSQLSLTHRALPYWLNITWIMGALLALGKLAPWIERRTRRDVEILEVSHDREDVPGEGVVVGMTYRICNNDKQDHEIRRRSLGAPGFVTFTPDLLDAQRRMTEKFEADPTLVKAGACKTRTWVAALPLAAVGSGRPDFEATFLDATTNLLHTLKPKRRLVDHLHLRASAG